MVLVGPMIRHISEKVQHMQFAQSEHCHRYLTFEQRWAQHGYVVELTVLVEREVAAEKVTKV
jgi:hypothetical protein